MKVCTTCKSEKTLDAFYPNPRYRGGVTSQCKNCARLYGRKRQQEKSAQIAQTKRQYYLANSEQIKEATRLHRSANAEQHRERRRDYYQRNRDRFRQCNQVNHLKRTHGINLDEYQRLIERQSGVCAICGQEPTNGRSKKLYVDHDHSDGLIRGMLCSNCNMAVGLFEDDPARLRKAAEYLERHAMKRAA